MNNSKPLDTHRLNVERELSANDARERAMDRGDYNASPSWPEICVPRRVCTELRRVTLSADSPMHRQCLDCQRHLSIDQLWACVSGASGLICDDCKSYRDEHGGFTKEQTESLEEDYRRQVEEDKRAEHALRTEGLHP